MPFPLRSTDALFRRYCRTSDPRALAAVFDRTAPELLRVAGWLSGNRADAEDLLQRTFLLAIESRATFDATQRALPWLCGILGNQARNLQREKARRAALLREGEPVRGPLAAAADAEFAAAVAQARQEIMSPYREVLELHLEHGLNSKEIAAQLGRPAGTVRTQLMRALELLRKRLPSGFVAGLVPLVPDTAGLTAVKAAVMAAAKSAGAVAATAGAATTVLATGGMLVAKKVLFIVPALALLLGVAIYSGWPWTAAQQQASPAQPTPAIAAMEQSVREPQTAAAATAPDRQLIAAPSDDADPGFASLRVTVKWTDNGAPAFGVGVMAMDPQLTLQSLLRREAVSDDRGVVDLRHLKPGKWWIVCSHGPDSKVELSAGQHEALEVQAQRTCTVRGRVIDPDGRPVGQARIWNTHERCRDESYPATLTDAGGWFTAPLQQQHWLLARKDGYASSYVRAVSAEAGADLEVVLQLRAPGGSLHGRVIDGRGVPIRWAKVLIGPQEGYSSGDRTWPRGEEIVTGSDGVFIATGVAAEPTDVLAWAPGHGLWRDQVQVEVGGARELTIRLEDGATVDGVVRDDDGQPVAGASIDFGGVADRGFAALKTIADAAGHFRLADLPAGDIALGARKEELKAKATLPLRAGVTTEWNPVLGKGKVIRGTVLDPDGRPLAGIKVGFVEPPYAEPLRYCATSAEGHFELANVGDRPVEVEVRRGEAVMQQLHDVSAGTEDLVVRLTVRDLPSAHLRGRIVDTQGNPVTARVSAFPHSRLARVTVSQPNDRATGAFVCGPLPAGSYDVIVESRDLGSVHLGTIDLAPEQDRKLDDVVLRAPGSASFTVLDLQGQGAETLLSLCTPDGRQLHNATTLEHGRASVPILQPGRYFAFCYLNEQDASGEFEVGSGANVEVALQAKPAVEVLLRLRDPTPRTEGVCVDVLVHRPDGSLARAIATQVAPDPCRIQLQPGTYRLDCRAADGRRVQAELTIRALDEHPDLTIDLPKQ